MKKITLPLIFLMLLHFFAGCNNKEENKMRARKMQLVLPQAHNSNEITNAKSEKLNDKEISNFVLKDYEIEYDAEGDLNEDGLQDVALVIRNKIDTLASRTVLVLIQNKDKTYRLNKASKSAFPVEYTESGYKTYDTEDINITKGKLCIDLYGTGPTSTLFSHFKYFGNDLLLTYIETYSMGAGGHEELSYNLLKGEFIQKTINTMKEDMPSKSRTVKLEKDKRLFENTSPDEVITEVYKKKWQ